MARTADQIKAEIARQSAQLRKTIDALEGRQRSDISQQLKVLGELYAELFEVVCRSLPMGPEWPPILAKRPPRKPGR